MKTNRIIIVGRGASGKDFLRKLLQEEGLTYQVSYTTRPARENEKNGEDYIFLKDQDFSDMVKNDEFFEHVSFNGWNYGTSKKQFTTPNSVFIMTPSGLSHLNQKDRDESLVIYLDIDEATRKLRMSSRKDADSVDRRIVADDIDFKDFENYDICIDRSDFTIDDIYNTIEQYSQYNTEILKLINEHTI